MSTFDTSRAVRSDPAERAGIGVRALTRNDRRSNRDRIIMYTLMVIGVAGVVFALAEFIWGDAWLGVTVVVVLAAALSTAVFTFLMRGAVAAMLIGVIGAALTVWWSVGGNLNWGVVAGGVVIVLAAVLAVMSARRARLPRIGGAALAAVIPPIVYLAAGPVLGAWSLLVAVLATAAVVAVQVDIPYRARVRAASARSHIPMSASTPFTLGLIGFSGPSGVDAATIHARSDASLQTAHLLEGLPGGWFVFHSRVTSSGALIDHVIVGPPGVIALRSEVVAASIRAVSGVAADGRATTVVELNGEPMPLTFQRVLCRAAAEVDAALMTPGGRRTTIAAFVTHEAVIVDGQLTQMLEVDGHPDSVDYLTGPAVVPFLQSLPQLGRDAQFVEDLAMIVDYLLPPSR